MLGSSKKVSKGTAAGDGRDGEARQPGVLLTRIARGMLVMLVMRVMRVTRADSSLHSCASRTRGTMTRAR